jgi:endonuclease YncB( thermonuclease family)
MIARFRLPSSDGLPWAAVLLLALAAGTLIAADEPRPQPRPHGARVPVPLECLRVDDADTLVIVWKPGEVETVRILGMDAPETQHVEHDIPFDQSFGREARAFAQGVFAMADKVELLRASMLDPYGRTLGYVFVNGRNYSVLAIGARHAVETVSVFGDNGLPQEAAAVQAAAAKAGPVPFEPPYLYRRRMKEIAQRLREEGTTE